MFPIVFFLLNNIVFIIIFKEIKRHERSKEEEILYFSKTLKIPQVYKNYISKQNGRTEVYNIADKQNTTETWRQS